MSLGANHVCAAYYVCSDSLKIKVLSVKQSVFVRSPSLRADLQALATKAELGDH